MPTDKKIDAYIDKAQDFAKPILRHIRSLVHKTCPAVEEKIKWSFPHFDYKGEMMCSMASFKEHCAFGFWKAALMKGSKGLLEKDKTAMGNMGRITSLKDLPGDKAMVAAIKEAMKLNDDGIKLKAKPAIKKEDIVVPGYFTGLLKKNKKASEAFKKFSPSHQREYIEWFTEAKTEETRNRRMQTALEWMSEDKSLNWRYAKKK